MQSHEQTALALRPLAREFIWHSCGMNRQDLADFDYEWAKLDWRGRQRLCVDWMRRRSQAERNGGRR